MKGIWGMGIVCGWTGCETAKGFVAKGFDDISDVGKGCEMAMVI